MSTTYIDEMNAILEKKRACGEGGIRFFAKDGRDVSAEDIAHDFVMIEKARESGDLKVVRQSSINL